jgi:hypothetical protein
MTLKIRFLVETKEGRTEGTFFTRAGAPEIKLKNREEEKGFFNTAAVNGQIELRFFLSRTRISAAVPR